MFRINSTMLFLAMFLVVIFLPQILLLFFSIFVTLVIMPFLGLKAYLTYQRFKGRFNKSSVVFEEEEIKKTTVTKTKNGSKIIECEEFHRVD